MKYLVKFEGNFAFIKPWTAVRDSVTKSNHYLTPSILMGIERKLFPELRINDNGKLNKIIRHRLSFSNIEYQQEQTESINYERFGRKRVDYHFKKNKSIIKRGILINPVFFLMFEDEDDANTVMSQHICLSRNEDVMLPTELISIDNENHFDESEEFHGYESFETDEDGIYCGYNKYTKNKQYINIKVIGTPLNLIF